MKIVNFTPGLGNQIFEYIFAEYLLKKYPNEKIYGYYNPKFLNKHNGLEVQNVFSITLPPATIWSNFMAFLCRCIARFYPAIKATDNNYSEKAFYFDGWWQNKCFFGDTINKIRFQSPVLDGINEKLLNEITSSESVSIHIRRGDYLESQNVQRYGGICTLDYYKKAIEIIKTEYINPKFFIFSNDINWCKENLFLGNSVFVTNNTGINSWLDMFLMSKCKVNIIANSSFSYWGAMLNRNSPKVYFPKKWFNDHTPNIFPQNWIGINE